VPILDSAQVNYVAGALTLVGSGFGSSPKITLGTTALTVASSNATQIVANFPTGSPPSSFNPGNYLLTVSFTNVILDENMSKISVLTFGPDTSGGQCSKAPDPDFWLGITGTPASPRAGGIGSWLIPPLNQMSRTLM
jgi:hypothetical protein